MSWMGHVGDSILPVWSLTGFKLTTGGEKCPRFRFVKRIVSIHAIHCSFVMLSAVVYKDHNTTRVIIIMVVPRSRG